MEGLYNILVDHTIKDVKFTTNEQEFLMKVELKLENGVKVEFHTVAGSTKPPCESAYIDFETE